MKIKLPRISIHQNKLKSQWWHRMIKVIYIIFTILFIVPISIWTGIGINNDFFNQSTEIKNISQLDVLTTYFTRSLSEEKEGENIDQILKRIKRQNEDKKISVETFIDKGYKHYGCLENDKLIELPKYSLESTVIPTTSDTKPCRLGDGIIAYEYNARYYFFLIVTVVISTVISLSIWHLFCKILYYRGLVYIIYGSESDK